MLIRLMLQFRQPEEKRFKKILTIILTHSLCAQNDFVATLEGDTLKGKIALSVFGGAASKFVPEEGRKIKSNQHKSILYCLF